MPSTGGSKRKGNPNADVFKTRKAKVGRRVARAVNDTDVRFRSASLHVGGQDLLVPAIEEGDATPLTSSRGKGLHLLVNQLQTHPSGKVRSSALRGILNILQKHTIQDLHPHLSVLLPALLQASNDGESPETREAAVDCIKTVLQQQRDANVSFLLPFAPLMQARISSALNSLDAAIRLTGVALIRLFCEHCSRTIKVTSPALLQPFVRLLAEHNSTGGKDIAVLTSLVSLLKTLVGDTSKSNTTTTFTDSTVDLTYQKGGRSRNVVLLPPRQTTTTTTTRHLHPPLSIQQLPCVKSQEVVSNTGHHPLPQHRRRKKQSLDTTTAVLQRLYDTLMDTVGVAEHVGKEVDPTNTTNVSNRGGPVQSAVSNDDHTRIRLVLSAVRWLHAFHCQRRPADHTNDEFDKLQQTTVAFLMDNLFENNDNTDETNATNSVDLAIVSTVLHVTSNGDKAVAKEWSGRIQTAVFQCLQQSDTISQELLDVIGQLVRAQPCHDLLKLLFQKALPLSLNPSTVTTMRSATSRRVYLLAMEQTACADNTYRNDYLEVAPMYLKAWGIDYLYESQVVIQTLLDSVRSATGASPTFAAKVRTHLATLFHSKGSPSLFEMYPVSLQRSIMGVMVMLQAPTTEMLNDMAAIYAQTSHLEAKRSNVANLILESVHSIRKSISMGSYMTFLINTIGMSRRVKTLRAVLAVAENDSDRVFETMVSMDPTLTRVAKLLLSAGPPATRVAELLQPQLAAWQTNALAGRDKCPLEYILKMRTCFVLMAFLLLAMQQQHADECTLEAMPPFMSLQILQDSIGGYLLRVCADDDTPAMPMKVARELTSPIVAIMVATPSLLEHVVHQTSSQWFQSNHLTRSTQCNILSMLLEWIKDSRLLPLWKNRNTIRSLKDSIATIGSSERLADNEPAKQLVRDLLAQLELCTLL